jgi:hypothetical protein
MVTNGPITYREKLAVAKREAQQRRRVYPRWVADGRMTQTFADRQIEVMQSIADDYARLAESESQESRLL